MNIKKKIKGSEAYCLQFLNNGKCKNGFTPHFSVFRVKKFQKTSKIKDKKLLQKTRI